jgi:hypothetical protein
VAVLGPARADEGDLRQDTAVTVPNEQLTRPHVSSASEARAMKLKWQIENALVLIVVGVVALTACLGLLLFYL